MCLCRDDGIAMYIAQIGHQYLIKRMPLSGSNHAASCASYDPPYDGSGIGALLGSAIELDPANGQAALKVGFSLAKLGARAAPTADGVVKSVVGNAKKLSLHSLLHYLWHEAELTAWTSRWAGKRHWWNLRWHLIAAARQMTVRGQPLTDILFVPEPFRSSDQAGIERRRMAALAPARPPTNGPQKLMILVGEVKTLEPARSGHKFVIKHLPGLVFLLKHGLYSRLKARFESELALWSAGKDCHLMAMATFCVNSTGLALVEDMALMVVSSNWIPYESMFEKRLVDALAGLEERSVKGLRFGMPADLPLAAAFLPDRPNPMAVYVVPPNATQRYEEALVNIVKSRPDIEHRVWRTAEGDMPSLAGGRVERAPACDAG
jgi:hypothetical protein